MDRMTRGEAIDAPARVRPVVVLATCLAVLDSAGEDAYGQAGVESGDGLLAEALRDRDVETHLGAWDDPTIEWDEIAACVLRSTWDYPERLTEFTRWMEAASKKTLLLNDADLVRWNIHKRYLILRRATTTHASVYAPSASISPLSTPLPGTAIHDPSGSFLTRSSPAFESRRVPRSARHRALVP